MFKRVRFLNICYSLLLFVNSMSVVGVLLYSPSGTYVKVIAIVWEKRLTLSLSVLHRHVLFFICEDHLHIQPILCKCDIGLPVYYICSYLQACLIKCTPHVFVYLNVFIYSPTPLIHRQDYSACLIQSKTCLKKEITDILYIVYLHLHMFLACLCLNLPTFLMSVSLFATISETHPEVHTASYMSTHVHIRST